MKKIALDTNAYSFFLKGNPELVSTIEHSEEVHISSIVIGELFDAFERGTQEQSNKKKLEKFLNKPGVMISTITRETAEYYSKIMNVLRKLGKPIPVNDVWIAAQAMEIGAVLVTYNTHFHVVPGLRIWGE